MNGAEIKYVIAIPMMNTGFFPFPELRDVLNQVHVYGVLL